MVCVSIVPFSQGVSVINIYIYENKKYLHIWNVLYNMSNHLVLAGLSSGFRKGNRNWSNLLTLFLHTALLLHTAAELGWQIVDRIDGGSGFHGGRPVQKSPVAPCHHFHEEDFQKDLGKLFSHTHPGAPSEWNVLKPAGVARGLAQEALRLEVLFVGKHLRNFVGVADAVDDVPAFGNLIALMEGGETRG